MERSLSSFNPGEARERARTRTSTSSPPLSDKPPKNLKAEPKYHSKRPLYGELELGIGPNNKIAVVVDEAEGEKPHIYVDRNRDQIYKTARAKTFPGRNRSTVPFVSFPAQSASFAGRIARILWAYRNNSCREGEIELDGKRYKIVIQR